MTQPAVTEHCWHPYSFRAPGASFVSRCCYCGKTATGEFIKSQPCPEHENGTDKHGPYASDSLRESFLR
jgi:hypothetical protein